MSMVHIHQKVSYGFENENDNENCNESTDNSMSSSTSSVEISPSQSSLFSFTSNDFTLLPSEISNVDP